MSVIQKAKKAKKPIIVFIRKLREQNRSVKVTIPKDIALSCKFKGGQTVKIYALDDRTTVIERVDDLGQGGGDILMEATMSQPR